MPNQRRPEVIVITGASAGVGRATAQAFARRGARIALLARGAAGLEGARRDVEALGGVGLAIPTDVCDPQQVERAAELAECELGEIDIWVNDAMVSVFSPVQQMTAEEYRQVTEVTYLGFVHGTLAALRRMLPRDRGTIVQVGSALAYRGIPLQSAYCAAKHAIQGFTESLRCELLHDRSHVRVTMVQMPALNTPQFNWVRSRLPRKPQPVPPIFQPDVAASAIVHAAHHYRRQWFVGASTVMAIQGNKLLPAIGDWYLARQGYGAQQHDGPISQDRRDNLYQPVDDTRDHGARGDFDRRAKAWSIALCLDQHRRWIACAATAGALYKLLQGKPRRCWRGGLVGMAIGALAALAGDRLGKSAGQIASAQL